MSSILIAIGLGFVILAGVIHVLIFLLESVLWRSRSTWRGFGIRSAEDAEVIRPWALNQGFYNLFLAAGAIVGGGVAFTPRTVQFVTWGLDPSLPGPIVLMPPVAWIGIFAALCMLAAAIVLVISSRGKLIRGALIQGAAPLVGLVLIGVGLAL